MMCAADRTVDLVRRVVEAVRIPGTVKMRLGWDSTQLTAPKFAREFEQAGVAAVAIHGRTRAQGFSGSVDLDGIRQVVEAVEHIPVIGNGDVRNVADAARMFDVTGCQGISVGRGALANPWIFRQLVQWEATGGFEPAGNFDERLALLQRHFGYLEELRGPEPAVIMFRKTGHWYLKAMHVRAKLRHRFQLARTVQEVNDALAAIAEDGPVSGTRSGILPDMHVPVPSGPVERW
jgi:nifR3 family TIM-barrel protein